MTPTQTAPSGLLNLKKPIGVTSRDVVNLVSRPLGKKVKVGHAGTLDPLASGVLVVCVGSATRLIEYVQRMPKTYRTTIRLGATSDTLDADGTVTLTPDPSVPDLAAIYPVLGTQVGTIDQMPPDFSALKLNGKRAYDLARAGEEVKLAARPVTITRVDLLSYGWPRLELEIDCGSGTYIRSIARDVGQMLGCGGLIEVLTRTRIGHFAIENAIDPDVLERDAILARLRPPSEAVAALPSLTIDESAIAAIAQGRAIPAETSAPGEYALKSADGTLIAIGEAVDSGHRIAPRRVLSP